MCDDGRLGMHHRERQHGGKDEEYGRKQNIEGLGRGVRRGDLIWF